MYKLFMALGYLRRLRITFFPLACVTLAVAALVAVMALMKGFTDSMSDIRGGRPDMSVEFLDVRGFQPRSREELDALIRRMESVPEVAAVSPYVAAEAVARITGVRNGKPFDHDGLFARIQGVDFEREKAVYGDLYRMKYGGRVPVGDAYGKPDARNVFVVGARFIEQVDNKPSGTGEWGAADRGDKMELITIGPDQSPKITTGEVVDVFSTGSSWPDWSRVYMPIDWARAFTRLGPNALSGIGVRLRVCDSASCAAAKTHITDALSGVALPGTYTVASWEEDFVTDLSIIGLQRAIMATILGFFLIIAAFSVAAILILVVLEKVRDIGVLRSMGSSAAGIAGIFLSYGTAIGVAGTALGLVLGVALAKGINLAESTYQSHTGKRFLAYFQGGKSLPAVLDWHFNYIVIAAAVAVCFLAALAPAIRAARMDPVEAIRHE